MVSRRTVLDAAFDEYEKPAPIPGGPLPLCDTALDYAGQIFSRLHKAEEIKPGGTTRALYSLPEEEQKQVREVVNLYHEHKEFGRHGHPEFVLDAFDVDKDVADAVEAGLEMDYVAAALQHKRGSDADLPIPELTRRDHLDAAFDAHQE